MRARLALWLVAAGLAALAGCEARKDGRGFVVLPGMVDSGVVHAYDRSPVTKSDPSLMLPPEGSVPAGRLPFPYGPGPEEAARAGRELHNPLGPTPANLERGKQVFENLCVVCHGPKGEGDGPIIGRFPNPPSLMAPHARGLAEGQVFDIITRGQGIMPSYGVQALPNDRWKVILYLRQMQGVPAPAFEPAAQSAATTKGRP